MTQSSSDPATAGPATSGNGLSQRDEQTLRKQAVAWYARLCSGEATEADHQGLRDWLQQHPDHQRAWERIGAIRQAMQRVPGNIALPTLQAAGRGRRTILRGILLLATTGSAGWLSYRAAEDQALLQPWLADYRTGVGERRSVALADGSRIVLNTDSAADVAFTDAARTITLWAGEILVETAAHLQAANDPRPFLVHTAHGTVRALGTRFVVRHHGERTQVSVLEHAVELRPRDGQQAQVLRAGESAHFTATAISPPQSAGNAAAQWEHGSLVVGNARLGDLIAELARYRPGRLVCDPAVADLRVSGAYPIDDTDQALRVLLQSFPLRMTRITRYWVRIGPA
ncbi:FecR domain-containing protein [Thauera linaloolentis]|uniref:Anti-FecI sigma factor FecR n=1 Tax=Thauera linaloolentis (strain DSM 12138 / JCM 21573 / CCUG 41526 / CIP 105981 / IAM 15112 / NBRC 102519 / 47Lol) TaxID=1123367 RepID=N6Y8A1_THAL4|nr:FecR domain-containing protein [Thauera linaloolentis]ENO90496.1 anti-FecI sigma factor FecR [Thauera linaloolentis 47Lol = DSM 12138]MCM8566355.1 FecR domain-containing protein [Thauera linaloolentis]